KYLEAVENYFPTELKERMHFGFNVETKTSYDNFTEMLKEKKISLVDTVTIGRVDLSGSMGLARDQINCDEVYDIVEDIFTQAKKKKFKTTMGGGIGPEAGPFIKKLVKNGLL